MTPLSTCYVLRKGAQHSRSLSHFYFTKPTYQCGTCGWQVPSGEPRLLVQQLVSQQALSLKEEYGYLEKDMSIDIYDHSQRAPTVMTVESQTKLLTLLSTLPHGVVKWSHAVPGRALSCYMMIYVWYVTGNACMCIKQASLKAPVKILRHAGLPGKSICRCGTVSTATTGSTACSLQGVRLVAPLLSCISQLLFMHSPNTPRTLTMTVCQQSMT